MDAAAFQLRSAGIAASERNLKALGYGSRTIRAWKNNEPLRTGKKRNSEAAERRDAPPKRPKRKKAFKGVQSLLKDVRSKSQSSDNVPPGVKIVIPKGTNQPRRDIEKFGKQNVIDSKDDCHDGVLVSNANLGPKLFRTVCVDEISAFERENGRVRRAGGDLDPDALKEKIQRAFKYA